jgi:plasmid stabilization system protein ParE
MRRKKIIFSINAKNSLQDIIYYLKTNVSPSVAEHVRKGILEKCKSLKNFSGYSKERYLDDIPEEYRSVCKWDYVIIYKILDTEIQILKIIHSHRHPQKRKDI